MKLLIVEDEHKVVDYLRSGLTEQGWVVDVALDGEEGMHLATEFDYDVIVLDVMIPGRNGFEVCRDLRKKGHRTPILMLTARDAVEDRITGLDRGADDYLVKPFEFRELLARLRALLRRPTDLRPAQISVADLTLDTGSQTAMRAGRSIGLTHKEYSLLEYLMRNSGRVIGRAEIAEHVWDETFDPFSNLIEVYVNRLRRKIDAGARVPLLHTRRGAGYLLGIAASEPGATEEGAGPSSRSRLRPGGRKSDA